jgi:hypothetical protein
MEDNNSLQENLHELVRLMNKIKEKGLHQNMPGMNPMFFKQFDMISENFEIIQDGMAEDMFKQFGIPIEKILAETIKALKKELGEDDFTEELIESTTENQIEEKSIPAKVEDKTSEIELIDQMLKRPGLSEVESDKLLDRRSKLQKKI